eukprot:768243-Hanusia_phi.AAC.1
MAERRWRGERRVRSEDRYKRIRQCRTANRFSVQEDDLVIGSSTISTIVIFGDNHSPEQVRYSPNSLSNRRKQQDRNPCIHEPSAERTSSSRMSSLCIIHRSLILVQSFVFPDPGTRSSFSSPTSPKPSIEPETSWRVSSESNGVSPYQENDSNTAQAQDMTLRYSPNATASPTAGFQEMYENRYKLLLEDNHFLQDSLKREQQAREDIAKLMREECGELSHQIKVYLEEKNLMQNQLYQAKADIQRLQK